MLVTDEIAPRNDFAPGDHGQPLKRANARQLFEDAHPVVGALGYTVQSMRGVDECDLRFQPIGATAECGPDLGQQFLVQEHSNSDVVRLGEAHQVTGQALDLRRAGRERFQMIKVASRRQRTRHGSVPRWIYKCLRHVPPA